MCCGTAILVRVPEILHVAIDIDQLERFGIPADAGRHNAEVPIGGWFIGTIDRTSTANRSRTPLRPNSPGAAKNNIRQAGVSGAAARRIPYRPPWTRRRASHIQSRTSIRGLGGGIRPLGRTRDTISQGP